MAGFVDRAGSIKYDKINFGQKGGLLTYGNYGNEEKKCIAWAIAWTNITVWGACPLVPKGYWKN